MDNQDLIFVNQDRLWNMLEVSASIGTFNGGLRRIALTETDKIMRDQFVTWGEEAGFDVKIDPIGNIFIRREGSDASLPPVLIGSHLDTQVHGGRYDGILGVLSGLEVLLSLEDNGIKTRRAIEVVDWTDEEGARFNASMLGSFCFTGKFNLDDVYSKKDSNGITVKEALDAIGYRGDTELGGRDIDTYYELHIEQGPQLYDTGSNIGVVNNSYDVRGMKIRFKGETCHVGPTPMERRHNALAAAGYMIAATNDIGLDWAREEGKTTCARISVSPNLYGIVADHAEIGIDYRHPENVQPMHDELMSALENSARKAQVEFEIIETYSFGQDKFSEEVVQGLRKLAPHFSNNWIEMLGQAGHDAYALAAIAPTAMIFTPCVEGFTHNEKEDIEPENTWPGVNLLLNAALQRASR